MQVDSVAIQRLINFIDRIESETYPEEISQLHYTISRNALVDVLNQLKLPPDAQILDVGCGQGPALEIFTSFGYKPVGITLNDEDVTACRSKGFHVLKMDQSFLSFQNNTFDLIWARHCLEHSLMPYFTLGELYRVMKPLGFLYAEVPIPDTDAHHENNLNHYSVLTPSMWKSLILRTGFQIIHEGSFPFELHGGRQDEYFFAVLRKP
ncbi:demethylmenaquinone methyltransferase / 2-methoxy-6-polyprenyl-1,4-benzoquinol methylase [Candidatus Brocadiaceae bacterium]|nr:demethylmenaquinone methyltransferase / 2-methoxy-6-polyprenyl-1,4-benzoquinol methylase [Candidatus Brocadiaceae bacterium]